MTQLVVLKINTVLDKNEPVFTPIIGEPLGTDIEPKG
jgi:hypothetical protein